MGAGGPPIPKELCPGSAGKQRGCGSDPGLPEGAHTAKATAPAVGRHLETTQGPETSSSKEGLKVATANVASYGNVTSGSQQDGYGGEQLLGPDSWGLLFGSQDPAGVLQLSCRQLDFGSCSRLSAVGQQSFTVTNTSAAKLQVFVAVPSWKDPAGNSDAAVRGQQVFQVGYGTRC